MALALRLILVLAALYAGERALHSTADAEGGAPQSLEDGNPPPPKP